MLNYTDADNVKFASVYIDKDIYYFNCVCMFCL
jgi:hypothetical protein